MSLFTVIRGRVTLSLSQLVRLSMIRTYGAEKLWEDDKDLLPSDELEFMFGHQEEVAKQDGEQGSTLVPSKTFKDVTAKRKLANPFKFIEFVVLLVKVIIDEGLLRLSLWCESLWNKLSSHSFTSNSPTEDDSDDDEPEPNKYLGLLNPGVWLRGLAYIVTSLVYGVVKCITSPWNWIVRPIVNYCQENWQAGGMSRAKPIIMLAAGIFLGLIVAASLLAMAGFGSPLALLPVIPFVTHLALPWVISLAAAAGIASMIGSMVVTHRIATVLPEAFLDAKSAIWYNLKGFDHKEFIVRQKFLSASDEFDQAAYQSSNAICYYYFNAKLIVPKSDGKDSQQANSATTDDESDFDANQSLGQDGQNPVGRPSNFAAADTPHGSNRHTLAGAGQPQGQQQQEQQKPQGTQSQQTKTL